MSKSAHKHLRLDGQRALGKDVALVLAFQQHEFAQLGMATIKRYFTC